ncbi:MAG TPA: hypothetical protein VGD61_16770 [Pyrinomonadaceae bacterium]
MSDRTFVDNRFVAGKIWSKYAISPLVSKTYRCAIFVSAEVRLQRD